MPVLHVNGRPAHPPVVPVRVAGELLAPSRAMFAALGATVTFDRRTGAIAVRRGLHFLSFTPGSRRAFIDNRPVTLNVAPIVRGGLTLVPLGFAAQGLGGHLHYLPARDLVDIEDSQAPGSSPVRALRNALRFGVAPRAGDPPTVEFRRPAPGEAITGGFPSISAVFRTHGGPRIDMSTARLALDGQDVTTGAALAGNALGYTPALPLAVGTHRIEVRAADASGRVAFSTWTFGVVPVPGGSPPGVVGYGTPALAVDTNRVIAYGGRLQFALAGSAGGSGYVLLCGYSRQYPLLPVSGNPAQFTADVVPPQGIFAPSCRAAAVFLDAGGGTRYYALPTPLSIDTLPR
jgi:hypothetical protein